MPHEIENDRAFFVGAKPWHSQGIVLDTEPTTDYALKCLMSDDPSQPDADCSVYDMPLMVPVETDSGTEYIACPTHKAIMRADKSIVGIVGADRETLQPIEQFEFFEPFRELKHVTLESGMSLREGRQLVLTAALNKGTYEVLPGDPVRSYLMFAISFDASLASLIKFCGTRVVCANTMAAAIREDNSNGTWKNKHTKNVRQRIHDVQIVVDQALQTVAATKEAMQTLARKKANSEQLKTYVHSVFEFNEKDASTKAVNRVSEVIELLDTQKGLELVPAMRGTYWQGYNAVTDYLTHHAGRSDSTRLHSNLFGANSNLNQKALELALAA